LTPAEQATPEPPAAPAARRKLELESHEPAPAEAPPAAPAAAASAPKASREAARTVFAAKQPEATEPASGRSKAVIAVVIGAVVILAAGGAYVWYEINRTPGGLAQGPRPVTAPRPVTPPPTVAAQAPAVAAAPAPAATAGGAAVPATAASRPETRAARPAPAKPPQRKASEEIVAAALKDSEASKTAPPFKVSRTIDAPRVSPEVAQGYEALVRGDAAAARRSYESAAAADPTSVDAHLGLATAAARMGDREAAARHYRRVLALDPKNPAAVAGIAALADFTRPDALEAQLRADLTTYPQSPALHYTLGNLYASQSRWNEAQSAYFEAYRLDPDSADLAYNLAVSLDNLGQSRLAADFYQRALGTAANRVVQFDRAQVSRRIAELRP
jgi:Flp pilus assembly protein TadD